jgi:hypothetical protein
MSKLADLRTDSSHRSTGDQSAQSTSSSLNLLVANLARMDAIMPRSAEAADTASPPGRPTDQAHPSAVRAPWPSCGRDTPWQKPPPHRPPHSSKPSSSPSRNQLKQLQTRNVSHKSYEKILSQGEPNITAWRTLSGVRLANGVVGYRSQTGLAGGLCCPTKSSQESGIEPQPVSGRRTHSSVACGKPEHRVSTKLRLGMVWGLVFVRQIRRTGGTAGIES